MSVVVCLDPDLPPDALWHSAAACIRRWAGECNVALRDAIVLLPVAAQLAPARRAFATIGGWMPRVETPWTLAASLGPPPLAMPGQLTHDAAFDALLASAMLARQPAMQAWSRDEARAFADAVERLVRAAHDLSRAAAERDPATREAWWADARRLLGPDTGPDRLERQLGRAALEWVATSAPPATDTLWALRPSAWIGVRAGGATPLIEALLASTVVPALVLDADRPFDAPPPAGWQARHVACDSFETEAQATAACVLGHLEAGEVPVALVAQDRLLVRRVRALLARRGVPIADETGWRLATTRAASAVMTLLRAARGRASTDELLDWLKSAGDPAERVDALEVALRRGKWTRVLAVDAARFDDHAVAACWHGAMQRLGGLRQAPRRTLAGWLGALHAALDVDWLQADPAGRQVVVELFGTPAGQPARDAHDVLLSLDQFTAWVDATLEQAIFLPLADAAGSAVVITPLARAMLRPFAAVVLPGADERRLGAAAAPHPLFGEALATALGLRSIAAQRRAERLAFAQLWRAPRLTLLRRRVDGEEPLAPSPLVESLALRGGVRATDAAQLLRQRAVAAAPLPRPRPAPAALPPTLSASQIGALRECPYRFYARVWLRLREQGELDDEADKRDYGDWLHRVLERFHRGRVPAAAPIEVERLVAIGRDTALEQGLDAAAFLPFAVGLEPFAARYVAWQHGRDGEGACHEASEVRRSARPAELDGLQLEGRIDRIDRERDGAYLLLDYKTSRDDELRARVREPFEDTQLAVYALLEREHDPTRDAAQLRAAYVALDNPKDRIRLVEHKAVAASAQALREGLVDELRRIRDGAALPPLGEGTVCETCEARGLCRRDDWPT